MSKSFSTRTLSELQPDEPVIDLTDSSIVLQFADCVRHLSITRRSTIWSHNVQLHHVVQDRTKLKHQVDDILLFLIIIYGKEQYPDEEDQLISKLKTFVASEPFKNMKLYIQQKYYPLIGNNFINNNNYFATMIEDYAKTQLILTHKPYIPSSIGTSIVGHYSNDTVSTINPLQPSPDSYQIDPYKKEELSRISTPSTLNMEAILYSKLEERMTEIFAAKFGELEAKINELTKEVINIKYAMTEEAKENTTTNTRLPQHISTDDIMDELHVIKQQMDKITKSRKSSLNPTTISRKSLEPITTKIRISDKKQRAKRASTAKTKKKSTTKNKSKKLSKTEQKKMMEQMRNKRKKLKLWLQNEKECELTQYYQLFIDNGLDDLGIMIHVKMDDLVLLGIDKVPHRVKLMQNIQKLKYELQATKT